MGHRIWRSGADACRRRVLQSVVMSGQRPLLCVGASTSQLEGKGSEAGRLCVSGDDEGIVRLYRMHDNEAGEPRHKAL